MMGLALSILAGMAAVATALILLAILKRKDAPDFITKAGTRVFFQSQGPRWSFASIQAEEELVMSVCRSLLPPAQVQELIRALPHVTVFVRDLVTAVGVVVNGKQTEDLIEVLNKGSASTSAFAHELLHVACQAGGDSDRNHLSPVWKAASR